MSEEQKPELTEEQLLGLGLGIEPNVPIAPPLNEPIQMIDGSVMNYVHDHIIHWMNNDVYKRTINLSKADKDRYFQMITDYGDLIAKLLNDDNNVIYEYVRGNPEPWLKLERHAEKSDAIIDYERPKQLIKEYEEWKATKAAEAAYAARIAGNY